MNKLTLSIKLAIAACTFGFVHAAVADTATPIKHLIVVVGENVSFDTLYATYTPPMGQSILNLASWFSRRPANFW